ncbi:unnamed protein product [Ilex paraguariensis]|uniref:Uncharacterized protein n=1 Tax=Ilex paraguariensis TaxID=185542 RepID=A0ABC8R6Q8_9AQUA
MLEDESSSTFFNVTNAKRHLEDTLAYQRSKGSYVLSHYDLHPDLHSPEQNPPSDRWDDPEVYDPSIWAPIFESDEDEEEDDYDIEEDEKDDEDF